MTKMSLADFRDSAAAATSAAELRRRADRAGLVERKRLGMEADLDGAALLLTAALLSSHFEDFPRQIPFERKDNGHNRGLGLRRDANGVWRVSVDDSLAYNAQASLGMGYMGHTILVSHAMEAMGIAHSPEAYERVRKLCDWGTDPVAGIDAVAASVPRHVLYSAIGHGSDFARFIGAKADTAFADGMIGLARKHRLGLDGGSFLNTPPALISCAERNDTLFVSRLLANGASVDVRRDEVTPAWAAVRNLHLESLELLAEAGANLNVGNSLNESLLHVAAGRVSSDGHHYRVADVVEFLLDRGVNPRRLNYWKQDSEDIVSAIITELENGDADERHLAHANEVKDILQAALSNERRPR